MTAMNRKLGIAMIVGGVVGFALASGLRTPEARAQKASGELQWEYQVGWFSYNPGERKSDDARSAAFARTLNEQARAGWEPVGVLLNRNTVQTIGGAVTTRDTTAFVAYRRPRR
jgi:hypothetical protein